MGFYRYRPEQGKYARAVSAIFVGIALLFACYELYLSEPFYPDEDTKQIFELPLMEFKVTWGLLIIAGLFVLGLMAIGILTHGYRSWRGKTSWLQRKSEAVIDFLVDVEGELRKVAWPPREQLVNSTLVVIVTVVIFGVLLFGMDHMVEFFMRRIGIY